MEGDPKAVKDEDATLQGEVLNESDCCPSFCGSVGIWCSSIGPSESKLSDLELGKPLIQSQ